MKLDVFSKVEHIRLRIRRIPAKREVGYDLQAIILLDERIEEQHCHPLGSRVLAYAGIEILRWLIQCNGDDSRVSSVLACASGKQVSGDDETEWQNGSGHFGLLYRHVASADFDDRVSQLLNLAADSRFEMSPVS